jgi:oligopeptidase B
MSRYCPYTNVTAQVLPSSFCYADQTQAYPSLLVTAGLHDPRVAYWEPLKWVSKLREHKTDSNLTLLETDLSSGHFSASDRYKDIKHRSFEMAFVIDQITAATGGGGVVDGR